MFFAIFFTLKNVEENVCTFKKSALLMLPDLKFIEPETHDAGVFLHNIEVCGQEEKICVGAFFMAEM